MPDINRILIIGIGGMARNVLVSYKNSPEQTLLLIDTDAQALETSDARYKLLIGADVCRGLGTGRNVARGKEAAASSLTEIKTYLSYADKVCLVAGLGGGTGSGSIQVIAQYALNLGKKVVCIVSTPFRFEGKQAALIAEETMRELDHIGAKKVVLNNQDLFTVVEHTSTFGAAFKAADEAICQMITEILNGSDLADHTPLAIVATQNADKAESALPERQREALANVALGARNPFDSKRTFVPKSLPETKSEKFKFFLQLVAIISAITYMYVALHEAIISAWIWLWLLGLPLFMVWVALHGNLIIEEGAIRIRPSEFDGKPDTKGFKNMALGVFLFYALVVMLPNVLEFDPPLINTYVLGKNIGTGLAKYLLVQLIASLLFLHLLKRKQQRN